MLTFKTSHLPNLIEDVLNMEAINIYCDESTHLLADNMPFLVLGGISCPQSKTREIAKRLFEIKEKHQMDHNFEIKWTKVSNGKLEFYKDLVDYFFDDDDLGFRVVVASKDNLQHEKFNQTHDDWYYKMMFYLIRGLLKPSAHTNIYLDKKDTRGGAKIQKLHDVIANSCHDFDKKIIQKIQIVESHHVIQLQLADLILGAVNYANRINYTDKAKITLTNKAKLALVDRIKDRSGYVLTKSTLPSEEKFNVFVWQPQPR